jgi:hypothetical protein
MTSGSSSEKPRITGLSSSSVELKKYYQYHNLNDIILLNLKYYK